MRRSGRRVLVCASCFVFLIAVQQWGAVHARGQTPPSPGSHVGSDEENEIRQSFARANVARQKLWKEIRDELDVGDKTLYNIPMAVSNEYQRHALRIAKLQRIGAIASHLKNDRIVQRVSAATSIENERHQNAIEELLAQWKKQL